MQQPRRLNPFGQFIYVLIGAGGLFLAGIWFGWRGFTLALFLQWHANLVRRMP